MKRVCCFCERWESGGIESFLYSVLTRMDLSGLEVDIVAAQIGESVFFDVLKKKGIRFVELSGSPWRLHENRRKFAALLQARAYDVVHFNLFQGFSLRYVKQAMDCGVPVRIAHSHNTSLRKSSGRWLKILLHRLGRACYTDCATHLWACSKEASEFLFLGGRTVCFIPNGIEAERFRFNLGKRESVRAELGLVDTFVVGHIGRLCEQKNQSFLLDVFAEVVKRRPKSCLLLVGEGEQENVLRTKAAQLGISERVLFYGVSDQVEYLLWAMDVFAFPSLFEGFGIVAVEGQASGLPILCSEYIPAEAGLTTLFHRLPLNAGTAAWAEVLLQLRAEQRDCFAEHVVNAGFDVSDVALMVERVYRGVSGEDEKREG